MTYGELEPAVVHRYLLMIGTIAASETHSFRYDAKKLLFRMSDKLERVGHVLAEIHNDPHTSFERFLKQEVS